MMSTKPSWMLRRHTAAMYDVKNAQNVYFSSSVFRPSEPTRIQPVHDGGEEEAERSGDAGDQGSSRIRREPRQGLLALTEIIRTGDFQKEALQGWVLSNAGPQRRRTSPSGGPVMSLLVETVTSESADNQ